MPSEQMVTEAPSARSICSATIWLVRLSSARRSRAPARRAGAFPTAPEAGRRSTASVPPPGRSPRLTDAPSRVGEHPHDVEAARPLDLGFDLGLRLEAGRSRGRAAPRPGLRR